MREFETPKIKHLQRLIAIQNMCIRNNVPVDEYKRMIDAENAIFERLNNIENKETKGENG